MTFEPRVIEVGLILTRGVALYSMADKVLCQLDAVAGAQYGFDLKIRCHAFIIYSQRGKSQWSIAWFYRSPDDRLPAKANN